MPRLLLLPFPQTTLLNEKKITTDLLKFKMEVLAEFPHVTCYVFRSTLRGLTGNCKVIYSFAGLNLFCFLCY